MVRSARYVDLRVSASPAHTAILRTEVIKLWSPLTAELIEQSPRLECSTTALAFTMYLYFDVLRNPMFDATFCRMRPELIRYETP